MRGSTRIHLTPKLFETLMVLVCNEGHLVAREALIGAVWKDTFVEDGNLAHNISVLRRVLGNNPQGQPYIETVPRHGIASKRQRRSQRFLLYPFQNVGMVARKRSDRSRFYPWRIFPTISVKSILRTE